MRRSMQLGALEALFEAVPPSGDVEAYRRAVLEENVIGQASASGRLNCWKPLRSLYRLDPGYAPFALLRGLWPVDPDSHRTLALLAAVAHDPLLRATVPCVLDAASRREVTNADLAAVVEERWPGRFARTGLQKVGQCTGSTWREAGYLDADRRRIHRTGDVRVSAAAYAFALGRLAGFTGVALLRSPWTALLEMSASDAEALAGRARAAGLIDYRSMGGVVELGFLPLLPSSKELDASPVP